MMRKKSANYRVKRQKIQKEGFKTKGIQNGWPETVSILFSGDTGFYSGTEKIKTELNKNNYKKFDYSGNFIRFLPLCGNGNCLAGCKNYKYPREKRYRRDQSTHAIRHFPKTFLLVLCMSDGSKMDRRKKLTQTSCSRDSRYSGLQNARSISFRSG